MKQIYAGLILAGLSAAFFSSCSNEDNPWTGSDDVGALRLTLASDGSVFRSTRADDTKATIVPGPEEFNITLSRTDGSSSQKWGSLDSFNKETTFPIGEYKLEAAFGDRETEGFTNPYYYVSQTVNVTAGDEKEVNLKATLANCMVSVRYTDEFTSIYPQYSAAVRSTGHDYVVFAGNENRPAYMCPSQMSLSLTMTNSAGKQVTIQPAGFTAQARRHYIITIGVTGTQDQGNLMLDVQFDEEVVAETVNVSLGDELFNAPEPTIKARDFNPDELLSTFENLPTTGDPRCEVYAFGGIKEVSLSISGSSYNSPFGKEVQFVNADGLTQSNVEASGLEVFGLFRNPDKMGIVKFKNFLEKLPDGKYTLTLRAKDVMTRESEPLNFNVEITPIRVVITPAAKTEYMSNIVEIYVSTNCPDIKSKSTFTLTQDDLDATIKNVETLTAAPSDALPGYLTYHYKYTLEAPRNLERMGTPVRLYFGSKADAFANASVDIEFPKFTVETDPLARILKLRIVPEDPAKIKIIRDKLVLMNNGTKIQSSRITKLKEDGYLELSGLSASTSYSGLTYTLSEPSNGTLGTIAPFTTESEAQIPNGDFDQMTQTLNFTNIQVGGKFNVTRDYTIYSSIVRNEPNGWASLNGLTCYEGSTNKNTWYMVPSTFIDNGKVIIRSVGYNHSGKTISTTGGRLNTKYYCENTPADGDLSKVSGELFLGSYSYDGTDHRQNGINFTSRPLFVTFDCKYTPVNNEVGEATIIVYDSAGEVIADGSLEITTSAESIKRTIYLHNDHYPFGKKAAKILMSFKSTSSKKSVPSIVIPTGSDLSEGSFNLFTGTTFTISANSYHAFAKGSELEIDNVKLGYTHN